MGGFSWIDYLNDPHLVARFQRWFGVHSPTPTKSSKEESTLPTTQDKDPQNNHRVLRSALRKFNSDPTSSKVLDNVVDSDFDWDLTKNLHTSISSSSNNSVIKRGNNKSTHSTHSRNESNCSSTSSSSSGISSGLEEDEDSSSSKSTNRVDDNDDFDKIVTNKYWYYLFKFGTALGDEVFYSCWFSFWFWNVDGAVGRRVVLLWGILMYIGQGLKDIIRWPRPSVPPVVRLEKKWELEYGMPSTHAVVGAAVPFATIIFTSSRYQYPFALGLVVAVLWCTIVCMSRLYLGMHSVLDIVAGLSLVITLFVPVIPLVDWLDSLILQSPFGGLGLFIGGVILCFGTPGGDRWSPARSDTFVILGSVVGLISGAWLNAQLGLIRGPPLDPPYPILWPSLSMMGLSFLRLIIGLCIIVASRAVVKSALYTLFHTLLKIRKRTDLNNATKLEIFAELSQKYLSYCFIGFNIVFSSPILFNLMGIQRPTFHTEI